MRVGFRIEGLGFRIWGLGFRVEGLGLRVTYSHNGIPQVEGLGFRVEKPTLGFSGYYPI